MDLQKLIQKYVDIGYIDEDASSKVCQDLILNAISNSRYAKNITVKGGVVMHNISKDMRRATRDIDFDFIKYSLDDLSIIKFVNEVNKSLNDINFEIVGKITPLHHQDYNGKRVFIKIKDNYNNEIETKLDIGVHKLFDLEQENYFFDFNAINLGANLLINSPEQIFAEKMKSLLKFNIGSTRYKDIFDFYFLIVNNFLNKEKLEKCFEVLIYKDPNIDINNFKELNDKFTMIVNSKFYMKNLNNSKFNWLNKNINDVIKTIVDYFDGLNIVNS